MLEACRVKGVEQVFFSSSACVYPAYNQKTPLIRLRGSFGLSCRPRQRIRLGKAVQRANVFCLCTQFGIKVKVARFHNIFGPLGTWQGGREKAPAAICRKVAAAEAGGELEIWGDGEQTGPSCT
jgi:nucleoside-diphosphate-sugar epimerase